MKGKLELEFRDFEVCVFSLLQHCVAVYVDASTSTLDEEISHDGHCVKLVLDPSFSGRGDLLLETLSKELNKLTAIRRPGHHILFVFS